MITLSSVRREWQNSFRRGNVELLAYIEADSFVATLDFREEDKLQRLEKIDRQVRLGRWVESGLIYSETVEVRVEGLYTLFEGVADTLLAGRLLRRSLFKETWCLEKGRWRILALNCTTILESHVSITTAQ